jgi:hypothetical protein
MSSGDDDASSLAEAEPDTALASLSLSKTKSIPKLETIPQSQPGSEILQKSTSSRTEKGTVQSVDPFRQAVTDAETAIDKLTTAYTVLSSIAQLASVAQELLPGVGAAVGILANMLKSARVAAVNKVAALRLVSVPGGSRLSSGREMRYDPAGRSAGHVRHSRSGDAGDEGQH